MDDADARRVDLVAGEDVVADELRDRDHPVALRHDGVVEPLQLAVEVIRRVEGGHERNAGAAGGAEGAPGRRPAAGMDDIDVVLPDDPAETVDVAEHDRRVLALQRQREVGDAPALQLPRHGTAGRCHQGGSARLMQGRGHVDGAALRAAREEVKAELEAAKRIGPKVRNGVALIRFHSPCQIHPLVAQQWRGRLKDKIVIAANTGYRPGWVHFAARSARDVDLIAFLAEHAPPGADENYGSGHAQATGGALRPGDWNHFITGLGFGPDQQVQAA